MTSPLSAADITSYLDAYGWRRRAATADVTVWDHPHGHRVLVPVRDDTDDGSEGDQALLRVLAMVEDRPAAEIAAEIRSPLADLQTIHIHPPSLPSGYVDLLTGRKAVNAVRDLYAVAARTALEGPRLRFRGQPPARVEEFLRQVQLGPAGPGSYVFALRVPVEPPDQQQLWDDGPALPRFAVSLLHRAVAAARDAAAVVATDPLRYSAFDEVVDAGVSSDLCEALTDLSGARQEQPFEIDFRWARGVSPGTAPPSAPETVAFPAGAGVVIRRAGEKLKALAESGTAQITGLVRTMHDDPPADRWRIRVWGELATQNAPPEAPRSLWVRLRSDADYELARSAQQRQQRVRAQGRLEVLRPRTELVPHADGFTILA